MTDPPGDLKLPADMPEDIRAVALRATPEAASELVLIGEGPDRKRAKAARRALYLLRIRGIEPLAQEVPKPLARREEKLEPTVETYLGFSIRHGTRFLHICPYGDTGPRTVVELGESGEVLACGGGETSLIELKERYIAHQRKSGRSATEPRLYAPIPPDYARHLLEDAERRTLAAGRLVPLGFHKALSMLPTPSQSYDRPLIYSYITAEEVAGDALGTKSPDRLLKQYPVVTSWPSAAELAPYVQRISGIATSPLVLTRDQQQEQFERILAEAVDAIVTDERRQHLITRLELDALAAWQSKDKELAALLLHHAVAGSRASRASAWPLAVLLIRIDIVMVIRDSQSSSRASETGRTKRETEDPGGDEDGIPIIRTR